MNDERNKIIRETRKKIIFYLYKSLLMEEKEMYQKAVERKYFSEFEMKIIKKIENNLEKAKEIIKRFLSKGWSWERISFLIQSILIYSTIEFTSLDKAIVINEALYIAKEFIPDKSEIKFINGILDNIANYTSPKNNEEVKAVEEVKVVEEVKAVEEVKDVEGIKENDKEPEETIKEEETIK